MSFFFRIYLVLGLLSAAVRAGPLPVGDTVPDLTRRDDEYTLTVEFSRPWAGGAYVEPKSEEEMTDEERPPVSISGAIRAAARDWYFNNRHAQFSRPGHPVWITPASETVTQREERDRELHIQYTHKFKNSQLPNFGFKAWGTAIPGVVTNRQSPASIVTKPSGVYMLTLSASPTRIQSADHVHVVTVKFGSNQAQDSQRFNEPKDDADMSDHELPEVLREQIRAVLRDQVHNDQSAVARQGSWTAWSKPKTPLSQERQLLVRYTHPYSPNPGSRFRTMIFTAWGDPISPDTSEDSPVNFGLVVKKDRGMEVGEYQVMFPRGVRLPKPATDSQAATQS